MKDASCSASPDPTGAHPAAHLKPPAPPWITAGRWFLIAFSLYVFLVSIGLMGEGFNLFGKGFAEALIRTTANPFVGLFVGILSTSIIQSSSTTTSMIVAFVASGTMTVENAVPIVMGANIGTTVTGAIVSLGHMARREDFRRAYSAASVHDMFNLMAVIVFLPLELSFGILSKSAAVLSRVLSGSTGLEFKSPLKVIVKPASELLGDGISSLMHMITGSGLALAIVTMIISVSLLAVSLVALSKLLKILVASRLEKVFNESIGKNGYVGILIGLVFTVIVQSSSVTTSLMVPLAAAGIMRLEQVYPVALGANLGTTVTGLLAALATGCSAGLTIALAHTLFNLGGILVFFPIPFMRKIPVTAARLLAEVASRRRYVAILFLLGLYYALPGLAMVLF